MSFLQKNADPLISRSHISPSLLPFPPPRRRHWSFSVSRVSELHDLFRDSSGKGASHVRSAASCFSGFPVWRVDSSMKSTVVSVYLISLRIFPFEKMSASIGGGEKKFLSRAFVSFLQLLSRSILNFITFSSAFRFQSPFLPFSGFGSFPASGESF